MWLQILHHSFFFPPQLPKWSDFPEEGDMWAHDLGGFSPGQLDLLLLTLLGWKSLPQVCMRQRLLDTFWLGSRQWRRGKGL